MTKKAANGWTKWEKYVLKEMERASEERKELHKDIREVNAKIDSLYEKCPYSKRIEITEQRLESVMLKSAYVAGGITVIVFLINTGVKYVSALIP